MKGFINGDQFLLLAPATTTAQSGKTNQHSALNIFDDAPINIIWSSGAMFFTSFGRSFLRRFGSLLSVLDTCNMSVFRGMQVCAGTNNLSVISGWEQRGQICSRKEFYPCENFYLITMIIFTEDIMSRFFGITYLSI